MKNNQVIYSMTVIALLTLGGCGSDSASTNNENSKPIENDPILEIAQQPVKKSGYPVVVERGAVLDANVTDANGSVAIQESDNNNTYIFDAEPEFPITAEGGWIDVDNDGNLTEADIELDINLTSYGDTITPTTTYLSDENATIRQELAEELAEETNSSIEDLVEVPSKATKNSIMVLNAVYEKLIARKNENSNAPLAINAILDRYHEINASVELDNNITSEEMAEIIEEQTIQELEEKGFIKRVDQEDIKRIKEKKPPKIKDKKPPKSPDAEEEEIEENNTTKVSTSTIEDEIEEVDKGRTHEDNRNDNGNKPPKSH